VKNVISDVVVGREGERENEVLTGCREFKEVQIKRLYFLWKNYLVLFLYIPFWFYL